MASIADRLDGNSVWEPNSGCRIWTGALSNEHGVIKVAGKMMQAHRVAWELERGPIPKDLWVLHKCGLGPCINVDHLRLGTRIQNRRDLNRPGGYSYFLQYGSNVPKANVPVRSLAISAFPRAEKEELDFQSARRMFSYDRETGHLRWRHRPDRSKSWNARFGGELAGAVLPNGYRYINLLNKLYLVHRVIWLWVTGEWPVSLVDHINRNKTDNRWANLRSATYSENAANAGLRKNNASGATGVFWVRARQRWGASIMISGKTKNLGRFVSFDEAVAARSAAEAALKQAGNA